MITFLISLLSFLLWLYTFLYTKKRNIVSKHKGSMFYKAFAYTDHILEKFIEYSVPSIRDKKRYEGAVNNDTNSLHDLHEFLNIDQTVSIKESTYISFSFENKVKRKEIRALDRNIQTGVLTILMFPMFIMFFWFISHMTQGVGNTGLEEQKGFLLIVGFVIFILFIIFMVLFVKFLNLYQNQESFLFDLLALESNNIISITINEEMVSIRGYWNNYIAKTKDVLSFDYEGNGFQNGIYLNVNTKNKIWVFRYPKFYNEIIFNVEELEEVKNKLNILVEKYKVK